MLDQPKILKTIMEIISFDVPKEYIEKALKVRKLRDEQYGNIYEEADTDLRWVGDLGEIMFNHWVKKSGLQDILWHKDNAAGKPDFTIKNIQIDIKTVKRKVPPMQDYTAQITARHKFYPIDELFFCSYQFQIKKMWFLGGISKDAFINNAIYFKGGEKVHSNYTIRPGHEIYNAPISILTTPEKWIEKLHSI